MERRKGTRRTVNFEILMLNSVDIQQTFILQVANISKVGIYVLSEGQIMPTLGSVVQVKLNQGSQQKNQHPLIDMLITRVDSQGIGLRYISENHANLL